MVFPDGELSICWQARPSALRSSILLGTHLIKQSNQSGASFTPVQNSNHSELTHHVLVYPMLAKWGDCWTHLAKAYGKCPWHWFWATFGDRNSLGVEFHDEGWLFHERTNMSMLISEPSVICLIWVWSLPTVVIRLKARLLKNNFSDAPNTATTKLHDVKKRITCGYHTGLPSEDFWGLSARPQVHFTNYINSRLRRAPVNCITMAKLATSATPPAINVTSLCDCHCMSPSACHLNNFLHSPSQPRSKELNQVFEPHAYKHSTFKHV